MAPLFPIFCEHGEDVSLQIPFEHTYAEQLQGAYVPWKASPSPQPALLRLNEALAHELGLSPDALRSREGVAMLAGAAMPATAQPIAQAYAGHQFGGFSPQLGDGRAMLLGELIDVHGQRRDLHLKGSGRTPFSRGGDGKAAVGPMLREYLMGEAMAALRIPTTRALAVTTTGEDILRQTGYLPGAVLARVASSHLRVGTFELFASRGDTTHLKAVADYAIWRHDPDLATREDRYMALLERVLDRQARLVAHWVAVGFVHGVMNTDNVTISGETIDYGPCAFIDAYDPGAVFSSIDRQGRYAYHNQPKLAQWNIARFAESLLELIDPQEPERAIEQATALIKTFPARYNEHWTSLMRAKLGLRPSDDESLITSLFEAIDGQQVDYTNLFRALSAHLRGDHDAPLALAACGAQLDVWLARWRQAVDQREDVSAQALADALDQLNPLYIPRNHLVEEALDAAQAGADMAPFEALLARLSSPYTPAPGAQRYAQPAPSDAPPHVTFCGT